MFLIYLFFYGPRGRGGQDVSALLNSERKKAGI